MVELLLDAKYFTRISGSVAEPMIFMAYTSLTNAMTSFVRDVFSSTDVYVYYTNFDDGVDGTLSSSLLAYYTRNLLKTIDDFELEDLFLISLSDSSDRNLYKSYYHSSIPVLVEHQMCLQLRQTTSQKISDQTFFNTSMFEGHQNPAIILFGNEKQTEVALSGSKHLYEEIPGMIIYTQDFEIFRSGFKPKPYPRSFPPFFIDISEDGRSALANLDFENYFSNKTRHEIIKLDDELLYHLAHMYSRLWDLMNEFVKILYSYSRSKDQVYHYKILKKSYEFTILEELQTPSLPPNVYEISRGSGDKRKYQWLAGLSIDQNFKNISTKTKCKMLLCGPGRYKVYGEIAGGYGWRCDLCPVNHYKPTVGDNGCIPCRGQFNIDNGHRTQCIDPYKSVNPNIMEQILFRTLMSLSIIGILFAVLNLSIFIVKRKTPVVVSSDFIASVIHLIIITVQYVMVVTLQFVSPSEKVCLMRVSIISIFYALSISFMFVKSQKLLQAFLSKVPITLEEARRTVSLQIATVFISVLITSALIIVVFKQKNIFSFFQDHANMERVYYCDTSFHTNVVIGFIMMIQFACFVQAFRGRHLPSVMNDGMSLVYASFTSIAMFVVMLVVVRFQKPLEKELYQYLTLMINNLVIWFMLYGQKAIRMLLYPEQNTKRYFQEQRMMEMREYINQRMPRNT